MGGVVGGGGEVELVDFEGGDGECGAAGVVEDVDNAAGDGGEEEEAGEDEDGPEAAEAEAAAAAAAAAAAGGGLGAVGEAVGVVEVGFGWWVGGAGGGAVGGGGGLGGGVDSVCHDLKWLGVDLEEKRRKNMKWNGRRRRRSEGESVKL